MTTIQELFVGRVQRAGETTGITWSAARTLRMAGVAAEVAMAVFLAIFGVWALRGCATACLEVIGSAGSYPVGAVVVSVLALVVPVVLAVFGARAVNHDDGTVVRMVGFAIAIVVAAGLTEWFLLIWAALLFG